MQARPQIDDDDDSTQKAEECDCYAVIIRGEFVFYITLV